MSRTLALALLPLAFSSCAALPPGHVAREGGAGASHPRGTFAVRGGVGAAGSEIVDVEDDTDGYLGGLRFESVGKVVGGGVQVGFYKSDDDLFESLGGAAEISAWEIYPHITFRPTAGDRFRAPIRVGPHIQGHTFDIALGPEIDWYSLGAQAEAEPEFDIVRRENIALSVYGKVRGGGGFAVARVDDPSDDTDYHTTYLGFGTETGLRFVASKFMLAVGFTASRTRFFESDEEIVGGGTSFVPETDFDFAGGFIEIGATW